VEHDQSLWNNNQWHGELRHHELLRRQLLHIPSTNDRQLLWVVLRQLRRVEWNTAGAAAAGAVVGVAAGAAIASANTNAVASNAYNAGVAAGSNYAMNAIYPALPAGCMSPEVGGRTYYLCGNTWFQPSYGANGVYYRVVPAP
jgi:hypothetical protein